MKKRNLLTLFDVSVCSSNLGDQIITESVYRELLDCINNNQVVSIASHDYLGIHSYKQLIRSKYSFVGGSNLLSSNMPFYRQWKISMYDPFILSSAILFGVGWWQYQKKPNLFTRFTLNKVLDKKKLHSVRDEYTKKMLFDIGIKNVINTGCPTMWNLTPEHCKTIPTEKSDKVITTITDYNFSLEHESKMLMCLINNYDEVYVWLQGDNDISKLKQTGLMDKLKIISPNLKSYRDVLVNTDIDYVGTRLHAGVFALQNRRKSLIISIDNRAAEISKDTNLAVISRNDIDSLDDWIKASYETKINLRFDNIDKFRNQLRHIDVE